MKSTLIYVSLLFLKVKFMPNASLLGWVFIAMVVDFGTGIIKSKLLKKEVKSRRMRDSIIKGLQNIGLIIGGIILGNTMKEDNEIVRWINDGLLVFIIYIEVYSILENFYEMKPSSKIATMIIKPLLNLLSLSISKNPLANKDTNGPALMIAVLLTLAFTGCKGVKPAEKISYSKTDSVVTDHKQVDVNIKGAQVQGTLNIDSILAAHGVKVDKALMKLKTDLVAGKPIILEDKESKVQLRYWVDEFGKLQVSCSSKDQTIQLLVAEITRLQKEVSSSVKTEVVYRMPWWGWMVIGAAVFILIISIIKSYK